MFFQHRARLLLGAVAALGLGLASQSAEAQQGTITVTAEVQAVCSVLGGGATLDFGTYESVNVGDPDDLADTSFDVECTAATDVTVSLDGGNNLTGSSRRMSNGSATMLFYDLYQDEARAIPFGDGTGLGQTTTVNAGPGTPTTVPVFGSIIGGQSVPAGFYDDVVQITLTVI